MQLRNFTLIFVVALVIALNDSTLLAQTLQPDPANPRWFIYGSTHLVLSGNGIWILIPDTDMDIAEHNQHTLTWGGNSNRTSLFSFCHSEELCPWERTGPGTANDGKPKYDLDKFNNAYWKRTVQYFQDCVKGGIFPLVQIWGECYVEGGSQGSDRWNEHPFNPDNNINNIPDLPSGTADAGRDEYFYNTKNKKLMAYQEAFVTRVLNDLGKFPVIWDIGNEIGLDTQISDRWMRYWADFFDAYQAAYPGIKILSTVDTNADRGHYKRINNFDVINVHGVRAARPFRFEDQPDKDPNHSRVDVKRMQTALDKQYRLYKKPLVNSRITSDPDRKRNIRDRAGNALEARHILWGYFFSAAHFISFRSDKETSWTQQPLTTEHQQVHLRKFIDSFEFFKCMPRITDIVKSDDAVVLAERGRQYAFYAPNGNHFANRFTADLSEAGNIKFRARWFNPRKGIFGKPFKVSARSSVKFTLPTDEDWALLLDRNK
ncbi:MAG: hypothetical protein JSV03_15260 [Planctomycetota bacterium]|nr:MAG: hypothetical protein JSV03_15260 [Planctomycetota bacterium]